MKRPYRIQYFLNASGAWQFRLASPSGVKMSVTESYASRSNCKRAVARFGKLLAVPYVIEEVGASWTNTGNPCCRA